MKHATLFFISLILTSCLPTGDSYIANFGQNNKKKYQFEHPHGLFFFNNNSIFSLNSERIAYYTCEIDSKDHELKIVEKENGTNYLKIWYVDDNGIKGEMTLNKRKLKFQNIDVIEYTSNSFPFQQAPSTVIFRKPINDNLVIQFPSYNYCAPLGYEPLALDVIFSPTSRKELYSWVKDRVSAGKLLPKLANSNSPIGNYSNATNVVTIGVIPGYELQIIESIKEKSWYIDHSMRPYPLGPGFEVISLPNGTIDFLGNPSKSAYNIVQNVIGKAFPALKETDISLEFKEGSVIAVTLFAPMSRVWPSNEKFGGYWIKSKFTVSFLSNGRDVNSYTSEAFLNITEGWLPKWPRIKPKPPPRSHYSQFLLSSEGSGEYKDFTTLNHLKSQITEILISKYNGTLVEK